MTEFITLFIKQLQSPTLGFLIGGMVVASFGSQLAIPDSIYRFITFFLLLKIGLTGGIAIRNSNPAEIFLPALAAVALGIVIVFIGRYTLGKMPGIKVPDAVATGGLFGAGLLVSGIGGASGFQVAFLVAVPLGFMSTACYATIREPQDREPSVAVRGARSMLVDGPFSRYLLATGLLPRLWLGPR